MQAKIEIRIWGETPQPSTEELIELFPPHVEKVASDLSKGCHSGEIIGEDFRGWWEIIS